MRMKRKILPLLFVILLLAILTFAAIENLNVLTCSGVTCNVAGLNSDDTNQDGATIGKKSQLVTGSWSDTTFPAATVIDDVDFVITHGGDPGIGGTLTIDFRNGADTLTYCSFTVNNVEADTKETVDTDTACTWTQAELDDLRVEITNNDLASPQNAFLSFIDLVITYTPPDETAPTVTLNTPLNRSWDFDGNILFNYTPSDNRNFSNCTIYIDDVANQTNLTPQNGTINNFYVTAFSDGNHTWEVSCYDGSDNLGNSSQYQVRIDTTPPNVSLMTPLDGNITTSSVVNFTYNVTDLQTNISSCELYVNGTERDDTINPQENTPLSFIIGLANGYYEWYINCTDGNGFEGTSEIRNITVNTTLPTITVQSPSYVLGEYANLDGENWESSVEITINYTLSNGTTYSQTTNSDVDGIIADTFRLNFSYPTGTYNVFAYETLNVSNNASTSFSVALETTTLTALNTIYSQGSTAKFQGLGYSYNSTINFTITFTNATTEWQLVAANATGGFTTSYALFYDSPIGVTNVSATDLNFSRFNKTANFTLIQRIVLLTTDLSVYGRNDDVTFTGYNFTRNDTVQVTIFDNATNATASGFPAGYSTNNAGFFTNSWNTGDTCNGIYRIEAIDQTRANLNDTTYFTISEQNLIERLSTPTAASTSLGGATTLSLINQSDDTDESMSPGGGSTTIFYTFNFTNNFNDNVQLENIFIAIEHSESTGLSNPSISYFDGVGYTGISCPTFTTGTTDHIDTCNITSAFSSPNDLDALSLRFSLTKAGGGSETSTVDFTQLNVTVSYEPVCTYLNGSTGGGLAGNPPSITTLLLEDDLSSPANQIDLNAGTTRTIYCNITVTDADGFNDIQTANATIYRTSVGLAAPDNETNHYTNSSCTLSAGSGNIANYSCQFQVQYYAVNGSWTCSATVADIDNFDTDTDTAIMNPLYAINITPQLLDFGILAEGQVSPEFMANLTNIGNTPISVDVLGYGETFGDNLSFICPQQNLSIDLQRFSASPTPYGAKTPLNSTYQNLGINLYPTQNGTLYYNQSYWQLQVLGDEPSGLCNGTIVFQATP